ncbi:MAG TPA: hypothetical protein VF432_31355 [Thermoanaerobaculia bacterium]
MLQKRRLALTEDTEIVAKGLDGDVGEVRVVGSLLHALAKIGKLAVDVLESAVDVPEPFIQFGAELPESLFDDFLQLIRFHCFLPHTEATSDSAGPQWFYAT